MVIPEIEASVASPKSDIAGTTRRRKGLSRFTLRARKRGLSSAIKRAFRRRSAVEPVIGHLKNEHRMGRNHLAGSRGDAANAVLAAASYNFKLLFRCMSILCA